MADDPTATPSPEPTATPSPTPSPVPDEFDGESSFLAITSSTTPVVVEHCYRFDLNSPYECPRVGPGPLPKALFVQHSLYGQPWESADGPICRSFNPQFYGSLGNLNAEGWANALRVRPNFYSPPPNTHFDYDFVDFTDGLREEADVTWTRSVEFDPPFDPNTPGFYRVTFRWEDVPHEAHCDTMPNYTWDPIMICQIGGVDWPVEVSADIHYGDVHRLLNTGWDGTVNSGSVDSTALTSGVADLQTVVISRLDGLGPMIQLSQLGRDLRTAISDLPLSLLTMQDPASALALVSQLGTTSGAIDLSFASEVSALESMSPAFDTSSIRLNDDIIATKWFWVEAGACSSPATPSLVSTLPLLNSTKSFGEHVIENCMIAPVIPLQPGEERRYDLQFNWTGNIGSEAVTIELGPGPPFTIFVEGKGQYEGPQMRDIISTANSSIVSLKLLEEDLKAFRTSIMNGWDDFAVVWRLASSQPEFRDFLGSDLFNRINGAFSILETFMRQFGRNFNDVLISGINSARGNILTDAEAVISEVEIVFPEALTRKCAENDDSSYWEKALCPDGSPVEDNCFPSRDDTYHPSCGRIVKFPPIRDVEPPSEN